MIKNDRQLGAPFGLFSDTKANIEALTGMTGGETAYATDTGEDGVYDAVGSAWVWGRSGGGGGGTPAGNDGEIQFNDDGDFGASPYLKFDNDGNLILGTRDAAIATVDEDGINLESGKTFRIDGVPIGDGKHPALQQISAPAAFDTDFRGLSSALPAGWAWAGSPFITPNTIQYNSNHLYFRHTGGTSRVFLYEAVPTVPGGLTHFDYFSYLTGFYNSNGYFQGLRIDDGTDNNYFEFGMQRATTGSPIRWYYYERNGGGSVVSGEFANYAMPFTPAYMWISLSPRQTYYSNWSGRGQLVGDMIFQLTGGGGKTWTPTRIGITQRRTADQWDISYLVGTGISYL